jgi:thiol:disulfide interchange protein
MIEAVAFAVVITVLSLVGLVWDITSGLITSGVDGLLLLLVCLMMGGLFSLQLLLLFRKARSGGGKQS